MVDHGVQAADRCWSAAEVDALFSEHYQALVQRARSWPLDPDDAEDLAAETFVRVVERLTAGRTAPTDLRGYLMRSLRNEYVNQVRRAVRFRSTVAPRIAVPEIETTDSADDVVTAVDFYARLARLSPRYRKVLWLTAVEDYTHEQVARAMDLPTAGAAAVLAHRARKAYAQPQ